MECDWNGIEMNGEKPNFNNIWIICFVQTLLALR